MGKLISLDAALTMFEANENLPTQSVRSLLRQIPAFDLAAIHPAQVRVKPLVWIPDGPEWPNCFHAESVVGRYEIGPYEKGLFSCHIEPKMEDIGLTFLSPDTAKAAAQVDYEARILAALEPQPGHRELTVWYGKMPESNGRENWTAILRPKAGDHMSGLLDGFCFARSEYPDRVQYEADRMRWIIGELTEKPDILAYDADLHSGYVERPDPRDEVIARLVEALEFYAPRQVDGVTFTGNDDAGVRARAALAAAKAVLK